MRIMCESFDIQYRLKMCMRVCNGSVVCEFLYLGVTDGGGCKCGLRSYELRGG